jgi:Flp pilus assembly protein TadB
VSRERARRREERERVAALERERRERQVARAARRRATRAAWRARVPRRTRWRGQQGILARRRRAQNAAILGLYLVVQVVVWLLSTDPWVRAASALLGVLALPVLVTLALDRRSRP